MAYVIVALHPEHCVLGPLEQLLAIYLGQKGWLRHALSPPEPASLKCQESSVQATAVQCARYAVTQHPPLSLGHKPHRNPMIPKYNGMFCSTEIL